MVLETSLRDLGSCPGCSGCCGENGGCYPYTCVLDTRVCAVAVGPGGLLLDALLFLVCRMCRVPLCVCGVRARHPLELFAHTW